MPIRKRSSMLMSVSCSGSISSIRHFCEAADFAEAAGWDILKSLRERIEDVYGNWYLAGLALRWGEQLEGGGLLE